MTVRLHFPLVPVDGRLACIDDEARAVRQWLGMLADLEPGELLAFPELCDPCSVLDGAIDLYELAEVIRKQLTVVGHSDLRVQFQDEPCGDRIGWICIAGGLHGESPWATNIPVVQRESWIALDLEGAD